MSSNLEVSTVVPFLLISIFEDGVAYPVINPEFATTIPNSPRLVVVSIGTERTSLIPSPIFLPLSGWFFPWFSRKTSFTNEFLTGVASFNNVINSSTVAEAFSNCVEMLANISFAAITFVWSFVFSSSFTYVCRSSFTVSRDFLTSATVIGIPWLVTVPSSSSVSLSVSSFGIELATNFLLFNSLTWASTSAWVADSFCRTSFALDNKSSRFNKVVDKDVFVTFSRLTFSSNAENSLTSFDNSFLSTFLSSVILSEDNAWFDFSSGLTAEGRVFFSTSVFSEVIDFALVVAAFSVVAEVSLLTSTATAGVSPFPISAWTIDAFAKNTVPSSAEVTPNENLRMENRCTWFHIFSFLFLLIYYSFFIIILLSLLY